MQYLSSSRSLLNKRSFNYIIFRWLVADRVQSRFYISWLLTSVICAGSVLLMSHVHSASSSSWCKCCRPHTSITSKQERWVPAVCVRSFWPHAPQHTSARIQTVSTPMTLIFNIVQHSWNVNRNSFGVLNACSFVFQPSCAAVVVTRCCMVLSSIEFATSPLPRVCGHISAVWSHDLGCMID